MILDGEALLEAIPKPAFVVGSDRSVIVANRRLARLFRKPRATEDELTTLIVADSGFDTSIRDAILTLTSDGLSSEFRWVGTGPTPAEYVGHASKLDGERFLIVLDHVSDQVASEQIFSVVREYLDGVLNQLPLGVMVLDSDHRVTFYNRRQAELFTSLGLELSLLDVIGAPISTIYPVFEQAEWRTSIGTVSDRRESVTQSKVPFPADDPTHHLNIQLLPFLARRGNVSGVICVTEDVTHVIQLEAELVRQERLAVAGQLVAKFHHEINNPLVSILGMAEMLLYRATLDEETSRRVERIRRGALRITEVTKKMREIRELGKQDWPDLPNLPDLELRTHS